MTVRRLLTLLAVAALAVALTGCSSQAQTARGDPFARAFRTVRPSVVLFTMRVPSDDPRHPVGLDEAYGSGLIVASGAWGSAILTVEHVIHEARDLRVTINDKRVAPVHVVARDPRRDLALVETTVPNLRTATLGDSKQLEPGDPIGLAGYPIPDAFQDEGLGVATSVYAGRISSVRKDALELDLPIIPGESGGPVFDAATGEVVGIAESRFEEEKAIGFAIPIDTVRPFLRAHARGFGATATR